MLPAPTGTLEEAGTDDDPPVRRAVSGVQVRHPGLIGACWPSPLERAVLRAAVLPPVLAVDVWKVVRDEFPSGALWERSIRRLLPLVYANLQAAGFEGTELADLREVHREAWTANQRVLLRARPGLEVLDRLGVPILYLKGVALAFDHYGDLALRPMEDVDVLVPERDADRALASLADHGWRDNAGLEIGELRRTRHASNLGHPDGGQLDLHWHLGTPLLLPGATADSTDDQWAAARPFDHPEAGPAGFALDPADLLLHLITHGLWAGSGAHARWAADASVVVRREVDWDRLVAQAARRQVSPLVADALRYLVQELEVSVPASVVAELQQVPVRRRNRRLLEASLAPTEGPVALGGLPYVRARWAHTRLKWGPLRAARELPGFVAHLWTLERPRQIPAEALHRLRNRVQALREPRG